MSLLRRTNSGREPPSAFALEFNDAYVVAAEQSWRLGFYNDGSDINPHELSYRMLFLLRSAPVLVVELKPQEDNAEWLVKALSGDEINITTFECPLDEGWVDALWADESSGWAGFRLPALAVTNLQRYTPRLSASSLSKTSIRRDDLKYRGTTTRVKSKQLYTVLNCLTWELKSNAYPRME